MDYPHLTNAPIREAIIDIKVKNSPELKVSNYRSLKEKLSSKFPIMEDRKTRISDLRFGPDKIDITNESSEIDAIVFKSEDNKEILQFKKTGLTFNRLEPYTKWEDIIEKAMEAWDIYKKASRPEYITRIAARYINNIILSIDSELDEYLKNAPKVPPEGPNLFTNSLSRITLMEPDQDIFVHLTQAIETTDNDIAIIIDIDAFKSKQYEPDEDLHWKDFKDLREMKNKLFFSSITNKTLEMYK